MNQIEITANVHMPQLGLGVWQASDADAQNAVATAIECGYRSIDTAAIYRNERGTGAGLRASGVPRSRLFVTTKLWNEDRGDAPSALAESLEKLGLDYVDLYLIHWPGRNAAEYLAAWRALIALRDTGLARAIGVSNFQISHLTHIIEETGVAPVLNQIELHPWLQQPTLREFHQQHRIATEAWSPIGQGKGVLEDPVITGIAQQRGRTPAQVVLRWHIQMGNIVIPKSVTPSRIRENIDVFGFELDNDCMSRIAAMNKNQRLGPDPDLFG